jgi:adenosine deaminase
VDDPAVLELVLEAGVCVSLNTDDPAQFGGDWLSNTIASAMTASPFTRSEIVPFMRSAIAGAWVDGTTQHDLQAELTTFADRARTG